MKPITLLLLLCCAFLPRAHAENVEYDFEIIVFEDLSGRYANSELWQHELQEPGPGPDAARQDRGARTGNDAASGISRIGGIGLKRYANALKSNKRYNVLVHKAWRQTGFAEEEAIDIPIDSRTASSNGQDKNNIHGSIRIVLGRYLHIYTDLLYQQPNENYNPAFYGADAQQYKQYPIRSHRRMRSKELHYLDHPLVGILVMAMPVAKQGA